MQPKIRKGTQCDCAVIIGECIWMKPDFLIEINFHVIFQVL